MKDRLLHGAADHIIVDPEDNKNVPASPKADKQKQHIHASEPDAVKDLPAVATSDGEPRPNRPDEIEMSEDGLAVAMGKSGWDRDARYVAPWGKWLFWNGNNWQIDNKLLHMTRCRAFLRDIAIKLGSMGKPKKAKLRDKHVVAAVEALARSNLASVASPDDFDTNLMLLGTPGGTVDLRTGNLRPALRGDMITKQTAVAPAPPGSTPTLWLKFLDEIFDGDAETIAFLQRAAGYALTGQTSEHKLLFLYGSGRNGKSVFLNALFDIWGDYARRAGSATFLNKQNPSHPTSVAGLQGARLVAGSELPAGKTWDESVIKDLTGGDKLTARFMRGDFFDFLPQLTLMIAGNNLPSFRGVDEAIRSRVVLVPFTVTIPEERRDVGLPDTLRGEAREILRWAIEGAVQWQANGLAVPSSIAAASADYFDSEDTVGRFLDDETRSNSGNFVSARDLHIRFTQWCDEQRLASWTQLTLIKDLRQRGYQDGKSNGKRGLKGLKLT